MSDQVRHVECETFSENQQSFILAAVLAASVQSDQKRNFDVTCLAAKAPGHQDYSGLFGSIGTIDRLN